MAFREIQGAEIDTPKFREVQRMPIDSDPGFAERVEADIGERATNVKEFIGRSYSPLMEAPAIGAVALGQVAGGLGDIVGETIVSGYKATIPEETQESIKKTLMDFSQTKAGKLGISALGKGQEAFDAFEKVYPDAALAIGSMLNVMGLSVGTKMSKLTAKELIDIGEDLSVVAGKTMSVQAEKIIAPITKKAIQKSIRPSVTKGKTAGQAKQYFAKANEAVQTIIENKNALNLTDEAGDVVQGLPTNLKQFTEAISSTKKDIFKRYDSIAKASGEAGAEVDLANIASELDIIINNKGLRATSPDIISYAESVKSNLSNIKSLTAEEAQDAIASLNNRLGSITDYNSAAKASVDSLVANKLRTSLNDVIEKTTGGQYKELKRKYGSLKEIERDVNRRAMVDARKNMKGLIDFTDVFTGAEVVRGVIALNPANVAAGLTGKTIASFTKALNDPNRIVKNMFVDVEKTINKSKKVKGPFKPKSSIAKKIKSISEVK